MIVEVSTTVRADTLKAGDEITLAGGRQVITRVDMVWIDSWPGDDVADNPWPVIHIVVPEPFQSVVRFPHEPITVHRRMT